MRCPHAHIEPLRSLTTLARNTMITQLMTNVRASYRIPDEHWANFPVASVRLKTCDLLEFEQAPLDYPFLFYLSVILSLFIWC